MSKKKLFYFGVLLAGIIQCVFLFTGFYRSFPVDNSFSGNILFTGDTFGNYDLAGCERFGSLSRRTAFLNKFDDALYLDTGNFTSTNYTVNKRTASLFVRAYRYMNLGVMNLSKKDLIDLYDVNFTNRDETGFVSANLEIDAPDTFKNLVSRYRFIPLTLKKGAVSRDIVLGVTGITDNDRKLHAEALRFSVTDIEKSLDEIMPIIGKADLKVLLFNESFFTLKRLIERDKLKFDIIIARPSLPGQMNRMVYIKDTPVFFTGSDGRTVGCITVMQNDTKFTFNFDSFDLGMGAPRDKNMDTVSRVIKMRIREKPASSTEKKDED